MTNKIFIRQDVVNNAFGVYIDEPSNIPAPVITPYLNGSIHPNGSQTAVYDNGRGVWISAFASPSIVGNENIAYEININGDIKKVQHVGSYTSGITGCGAGDICLEGINVSFVCGEGYTICFKEFIGQLNQPIRFRIPSIPTLSSWTVPTWVADNNDMFGYQYVYDFVVGQTYTIDVEMTDNLGIVVKSGNVTIRPNQINCASPTSAIAVNDTNITGTIGVEQTFNVSTNDTPCNNSATTTYVLQGTPTNVTVSLAPSTGVATFTPTAASWSFQYAIYCNGVKASENATVSGTATPPCQNVSVVSNTLNTQTQVNSPVTGSITLGGTAPFTLGAISGIPTGTTVSLFENTISLTGNTTIVGTYNYSISVTNCTSGTTTITGTLSINTAPSCPQPQVTTNLSPLVATQNIAYTGTIIVSNTTSATITGLPNGLSSSLAGNTITITGTPTVTGSFILSTSLTNNCGGGSTTSTLSNYPLGTLVVSSQTTADAKNDIINVEVNTATSFDLKLDNGSGIDVLCTNNETTTFVLVTLPSHGTISGFSSSTGIGTYTPNTDYLGTDGASYKIMCDGVQKDTATITFNVSSTNVTGNILGEASPYCGKEYTYNFSQTGGSNISSYNWSVLGGVIKYGNGTGSIVIKWDENVYGNKTITLSANNPNPFVFTKQVSVVCASANDDVFISENGEAITINVTGNDVLCNTGTSKIMITTPPLNGNISFQNPFLGIFTYKPNEGFYGKDIFYYKIYCNNIEISEAQVIVNVISTDPCFGKTQEACWIKTEEWKCVNKDKMRMWKNTNVCYTGEQIRWVKDGKCESLC